MCSRNLLTRLKSKSGKPLTYSHIFQALSCCHWQRLREEFQTMNGDDLEENESEEETEGGNQLKKMIKSKITHSLKKPVWIIYFSLIEIYQSVKHWCTTNLNRNLVCPLLMKFSLKLELTFLSCLIEGEIPDAMMIHMIRKKRQQARDYGDFIPLDDTERVENSKSRLVRSVILWHWKQSFTLHLHPTL